MQLENISAKELVALISNQAYQIIDLRNVSEFHKQHVKNAVQIDSKDILSNHLEKIHKRYLIVYCARGGESMRVARQLSLKGYYVKNVIGGFYEIKNYQNILNSGQF